MPGAVLEAGDTEVNEMPSLSSWGNSKDLSHLTRPLIRWVNQGPRRAKGLHKVMQWDDGKGTQASHCQAKSTFRGSRLSKERCFLETVRGSGEGQSSEEGLLGRLGAQRYLRIIIQIFVNFLFYKSFRFTEKSFV